MSARPEGVAVPSQARFGRAFGGAPNASRAQLGQFLERRRIGLHAGAAMLTSIAAAAHILDQVPNSIAPACAALAAVLATLMAGLSWTSQGAANDAAVAASNTPSGANESSPTQPVRWSHSRTDGTNASLAAELAQAAALAQLTARISHDLRTPLNAVIGFSELMSSETFGPLGSQRYQDYAKHIRECGQTLLKSTEDTLAITSALAQPMGDSGNNGVRPLSLTSLVDEAWSSVACHATQAGVAIDCEVGWGLEIFGDRRVMRQILVNLFQDAISRAQWNARIVVRANLDRRGICLVVETQGCLAGGQEETLALSVARALLELHGLPLSTTLHGQDVWRVRVNLDLATQPDFFFEAAHHTGTGLAA